MSTYASVGLHRLCLRLLADVSFHVPVLLAIVHAMAWPAPVCRQIIHVLGGKRAVNNRRDNGDGACQPCGLVIVGLRIGLGYV